MGHVKPPVLEGLSSSFKEDYGDLFALVFVDTASNDDVEKAYETRKKMVSGVSALKSRFAKALDLFPTGRLVQERVDVERQAVKKMHGASMDIVALEDMVKTWAGPPQLAARTSKQSVHFSPEQIGEFKTAWAKWAVIQEKMTDRLQRSAKAQLEELEKKLALPMTALSSGLDQVAAHGMRTLFEAHAKILSKAGIDAKDVKKMKDDLETLKCVIVPDLEALGVASFATKERFAKLEEDVAVRRLAIERLLAGSAVLMTSPLDLHSPAFSDYLDLLQSEAPEMLKGLPDTVPACYKKFRQAALRLSQVRCKVACQEKFVAMGPLAAVLQKTGQAADQEAEIRAAFDDSEATKTAAASVSDALCALAEAVLSNVRHAVPSQQLQIKHDGGNIDVDVDFVLLAPAVASFCNALRKLNSAAFPVNLSDLPEDSNVPEEQKQQVLTWAQTVLSLYKELQSSRDQLNNFITQWERVDSAAKPFLPKIQVVAEGMSQAAAAKVTEAAVPFFEMQRQAFKRSLDTMAAMDCDAEALFKKLDSMTKTLTLDDRAAVYPSVTSLAARALFSDFRWLSETAAPFLGAMKTLNGEVDPFNFETDEVSIRAGAMAASMTILQSFWRALRPGEDRVSLVRKCIRAMNPATRGKLMKAHACVHACVHNLQAVVEEDDSGLSLSGGPDASGTGQQAQASQHALKRRAEQLPNSSAKKAQS